MKTITLNQAFNILQNCAAVVTETHNVTYPNLDKLTGEEENEFMALSWEEDGLDYGVIFKEGNNQTVKVSGSSMFLEDNEGEEVQLTILVPQNLENLS